jgi:inner membrane protein
MILPTHLVASQAFFYVACIIAGHAPTVPEAATAAAGGMFPDIESRQSVVGRLIPPLSEFLEHEYGHRTITHAALAQLVLGIVLYFTLPFGFFLAFISGWISHTSLDMMTLSGVCYWYPSRVRCVLPAYAKYRFKIMGWGELVFCAILTVLVFPLHSMAITELGTTGLIRQSIGDITAARETYNAQRGDYAFRLEIVGKDNRTLESINGTYEVVRPFRENGFIVRHDGQDVSVCKQTQQCLWYAERAILHRQELIQKSGNGQGEKGKLLEKWL